MGQTLNFEYDEGDFTEESASRLISLLNEMGESEIDDLRLRLEIESSSCLLQPGDSDEYVSESNVPVSEVVDEEENNDEETDAVVDEDEDEEEEEEEELLPTVNPDTHKYATGAVLYHADEALTTREISEALKGTDYERGSSPISSELYQMVENDLVERHDSPYKHELTEIGVEAIEQSDAPIEPNPFDEESSEADDQSVEEDDVEDEDSAGDTDEEGDSHNVATAESD